MVKINFENGVTPINDTNLNQLQTNIENAIQSLYPVGSIYLSTINTNPAILFGFGTWIRWGQGRVPVGVDENDADFSSSEKMGGEKKHRLTQEELPVGTMVNVTGTITVGQGAGTISYNTSSQSHNILQPYIACYMWKRTQ